MLRKGDPLLDQFISVGLRDPYLYSALIYVIGGLLCLTAVSLVVPVFRRYRPRKAPVEREIVVKKPVRGIEQIRAQYLRELHAVRQAGESGSMSRRACYQELSRIIRMFVYEATGIEVQNYSFREISAVGIAPLTELVREYYEPEFAMESEANALHSLEKTERMMRAWK